MAQTPADLDPSDVDRSHPQVNPGVEHTPEHNPTYRGWDDLQLQPERDGPLDPDPYAPASLDASPAGPSAGDDERFLSLDDAPAGFLQVDLDRPGGAPSGQPNRSDANLFDLGTNEQVIAGVLDDYTSDREVLDDFTERQGLGRTGSEELLDLLREHHSQSPSLSGNDVDADWARADQSGEETVGGSVATPGQDVVEELGEAWGIQYADDQPLDTAGRLERRDEQRWELDPASAMDREDAELQPLMGDAGHTAHAGELRPASDPEELDDDPLPDDLPGGLPGDLLDEEVSLEVLEEEDDLDEAEIDDEDRLAPPRRSAQLDEDEDADLWVDDDDDDFEDLDDEYDELDDLDDDFLLGGADLDDEDY
ncbi:MAG: DUF6335 family protein [Chloroflexota bacterium]